MSWSLKLFTIRGIPIRVHGSFLLILVWAAWLGFNTRSAGWPLGVLFWVVFTLLLFVCVVLHELGHSLVAQLFGVTVQDITLWPIGGVARSSSCRNDPTRNSSSPQPGRRSTSSWPSSSASSRSRGSGRDD